MFQHNLANCNRAAFDKLRDLIPAYAIGAVDHDEKRHLDRLLAACPEARQELAEYVALTEVLYAMVKPIEPPAALHEKLLARLRNRN